MKNEMTTNQEFMQYYNGRIARGMAVGTLEQEYEMYLISVENNWL